MSKEKKKKSGFGKFLLGAAIGATAGVLLAPKKGSETRRELKLKFDELILKIKEIDKEELKEKFFDKVQEIQEDLSDLDREKFFKLAKEKGKIIKAKVEELVKLAIEKGTPIVQQKAKELRVKTLESVESYLKKLEAKDLAKEEIEKEVKREVKKTNTKKQ